MKKMRNLLILLFFATIFTVNTNSEVKAADYKVYVQGEEVNFIEQSPVNQKGTLLIPLREVFESVGADIEWKPNEKQIIISMADRSIKLTINNTNIEIDEGKGDFRTYKGSVAPQIINGFTYIPLRASVESLKGSLDWNAEQFAAYITFPENVLPKKPVNIEADDNNVNNENNAADNSTTQINTKAADTVTIQSTVKEITVANQQSGNINLGDDIFIITSKLGQPDRKGRSLYGFEWYVYNKDLSNYMQVGVANGKVVAVMSNAKNVKVNRVKAGGDSKALESAFPGSGVKSEKITLNNEGYVLDIYKDKNNDYSMNGFFVREAQYSEQSTVNESLAIKSLENDAIDIINAERAKRDLSPVVYNDKLYLSAQGHSNDMAKNNYFEFNSKNGKTPFNRIDETRIGIYNSASENIAYDHIDILSLYSYWMKDVASRNNILNDDFNNIGVAVSKDGSNKLYFTADFCSLDK